MKNIDPLMTFFTSVLIISFFKRKYCNYLCIYKCSKLYTILHLILLTTVSIFMLHLNTFKYILANLCIFPQDEMCSFYPPFDHRSTPSFSKLILTCLEMNEDHMFRKGNVLKYRNIQNEIKYLQYRFPKAKTISGIQVRR